jgi:hypothetical protein
VANYAAVFARAIDINSIFTKLPKFDPLTAHLLASYHHHGDALFRGFMEL